jgi:Metallo-peptidase family M12B Reprolysin-like/Bacterial Ig domain
MTRRLLIVCLALAAGFPGLRGGAAQPAVPGLLADAPAGLQRAELADVATRADTVQARATTVNLAALDAEVVDVAVTSSRTLRAQLVSRTENPDGSESWSGQVVGEPLSAATFVRAGGILQGSLRTLDAAYSIEPLGTTGLHVVREIDLQAAGDELPARLPQAPAALADMPGVAGDDGSVFDVLVVYTPAARTVAGSDANMVARINLGVTETNTAYANSGVIPRLRLVGAEAVTYTESGDLGLDLDRVTDTMDGFMDAVHARRNAVGADLVQLVVGDAAGGACGVAWLMTSLSSLFASSAFSVTAYPCISPNYTFGHEIGHNLGSNHAPDDPQATIAVYPYSYGYKHPGNAFRTVMAYNCSSGGCPRILYFSNPSVLYNGLPTGTAAQHNNALSINNARNTVANWRQTVSANTAPTISGIANRTTTEDTPTPGIFLTVGDAQTPAASLTLAAASSNTAVVANTAAAFTFGGSGANRTLVVTPQPEASGTSTITVGVSDGVLTTSTTFELTVIAVNDAPLVSAVAPQFTDEEESVAVPFAVADAESAAASLTVQATSSNTALVSAAGIGLGGSGSARLVTLTPKPNATGVTTITLSVSDGTATTQRAFTLTVSPANDPPAFVSLAPLVSTTRDVPASFAVTLTDPDTAGSGLTLSATTSNPVLLPQSGMAIAATGSTASTRTFQVTLTPGPGRTGSSTLILQASDGSTATAASVAFTVTATPAAPNPPTTLTAAAEGLNVTLAWTPALSGSAPDSFSVEIGSSVGITTLPTQSVSWPATTLSLVLPAGTYYTRVRAVNGTGTSAPSPESSVVVTEPSPIPGPPGNFFGRTMGRTVSLYWTGSAAGEPATSYTIEAGSAPGLANLAVLVTGTAATTLDVSGVPPGTYWVRVRGSNAAGIGSPSQEVAIVMGSFSGCVGLPGAPVLLTPVVSGDNVNLNWNAPATGSFTTGYVLMAGSAPGTSNLANFSTGNAATSFAASAPAGLYYVRVAAANGCGTGVASNEVSFTLGADPPGAPGDLAWTVADGGLVTLSWTAPVSGVSATTYVVEAGSASGLSDLATISTGAAVTAFSATAPPGAYYVRVRAVNGAGAGPPSAEVLVIVP